MSALPPKADMRVAKTDVRFVPITDIAPYILFLFNQLVSACEQHRRDGNLLPCDVIPTHTMEIRWHSLIASPP
jgi:hypothetical protein